MREVEMCGWIRRPQSKSGCARNREDAKAQSRKEEQFNHVFFFDGITDSCF
jgi:hypothetical protein